MGKVLGKHTSTMTTVVATRHAPRAISAPRATNSSSATCLPSGLLQTTDEWFPVGGVPLPESLRHEHPQTQELALSAKHTSLNCANCHTDVHAYPGTREFDWQVEGDVKCHYQDNLLGATVFPTSVASTGDIPKKFALEQNYPNPFNPSTAIRFDLPVSTPVSMTVYDALGRKVAQLINGDRMQAGTHEVEFNPQDLASGLYFYRIQAGSYSAVRKLVLLRGHVARMFAMRTW